MNTKKMVDGCALGFVNQHRRSMALARSRSASEENDRTVARGSGTKAADETTRGAMCGLAQAASVRMGLQRFRDTDDSPFATQSAAAYRNDNRAGPTSTSEPWPLLRQLYWVGYALQVGARLVHSILVSGQPRCFKELPL